VEKDFHMEVAAKEERMKKEPLSPHGLGGFSY
jgi:hypothetical protein